MDPPAVAYRGLTGKVALVTGGANGIGRAVALAFAAVGADISLADLDEDGLGEVKEQLEHLGVRVLASTADVREPSEVTELVERTRKTLGGLDVLACVAGGSLRTGTDARSAALETTDVATWDAVFSLNVRSTFLCAQAVVPILKAQRWGRIITTSSSSFRTGGPPDSSSAYVAAKSAVVGLTRRLALELAPHGITVNAVAPGPTLSERFRRDYLPALERSGYQRIPAGRAAEVGEVAAAYAFLASPEASYVTGVVLDVGGGGSFG